MHKFGVPDFNLLLKIRKDINAREPLFLHSIIGTSVEGGPLFLHSIVGTALEGSPLFLRFIVWTAVEGGPLFLHSIMGTAVGDLYSFIL
jgi:uncharacterized membrane protein